MNESSQKKCDFCASHNDLVDFGGDMRCRDCRRGVTLKRESIDDHISIQKLGDER